MNFATIHATFDALFAALSGLPCHRAEAAWTLPGEALGKVRYTLISVTGLGRDEYRNAYVPVPAGAIDGDTYAGPGAPLGGIATTLSGNRSLVYAITVEQHNQTQTALPALEAIRTGLRLPSSLAQLRAAGLGVARVGPAKDVSVFWDGRQVSQWQIEATFNAADSAADPVVTTIESVDVAAGPE